MNTHMIGTSGLINFRDFGGQSTGAGSVRSGLLYRCGHLARVADGDLAYVLSLDFDLVADLRYTGERDSEPSPWPLAFAERVLCHGSERDAEAPHLAMLRTGSQYLEVAPWIGIAPGVAIFLTVLAFNFVGDGLRRALDPRLAGRRRQ